ncbi:hypothetical protein [uncultured Photobacterium sp.]|uniref:hypothetical protein n=1 Tax=uncultured Photobacterium sp. TaxID=173973 RepID=UPI00260BA046|nr:hypothetical protein [uncultured Photobacterium sp.]
MKYRHSTLALVIVTALAGCNAEDNKELDNKNNNIYAPVVKGDVTIPALHVGETVSGMYQYFDPNPQPRPEGNSQYVWLDDQGAELGTEQALQLIYDHSNRNVKFCVTPIAKSGVNVVGEQACSELKPVNEPLGEKPVALNVAVSDSSPSTGDTLQGSYEYSHVDGLKEGESQLRWYADDTVLAGEEGETLALAADKTEGKRIKFCVTPETNGNPALQGVETCSESTSAVAPSQGLAPVANNLAINGEPYVGAALIGNYEFADADNDPEGTSEYRWLRGGNAIAGATQKRYTATEDDNGEIVTFCVKPVSATGIPSEGTEVCQAMNAAISKKVEAAPTATNVAYSTAGDIPEVGAVLTGIYEYQQADEPQSPEGESAAFWKVDNVPQDDCTDVKACNYTVGNADLGKVLQFCVKPRTVLGTPADQAFCSADINPVGIKISGELEYDKQLLAVAYGYTEDLNTAGHWKVDSSNQNGPADQTNLTEQVTGNSYQIGVRNGLASDYAWFDAQTPADARNFIGKSVTFCLDTQYGEKCVNAADFTEVTGGLYYDATNAALRGIEPVREVSVGSSTYHRPLTKAEAALKELAKFGAGIPNADSQVVINGIEWALFTHDSGAVLGACRNLYINNGEWHLPQGYFSDSNGRYAPNAYVDEGNNPPTNSKESLKVLNETKISTKKDDGFLMSPVFGWPTGADGKGLEAYKITYNTSTKTIDPGNSQFGNYYVIRMYGVAKSNTSAAGKPGDNMFISCVK